MNPQTGLFPDIPFEHYKQWDCWHKSIYTATMRSARHLKLEKETEKPQTDSMLLGSLTDALLLEPKELAKYSVLPETYTDAKTGQEKPWNLRANVCKEIYAEMCASGTPIKADVFDTATNISAAVRAHKMASKLIEGDTQLSMVWEDPETHVLCKGRIDINHSEALVDLKTTKDASPAEFARDAYNFGYHVQAALYVDGYRIITGEERKFYFIAVENKAPFGCAVYEIGQESLDAGRIQYRLALHKYKSYLDNDPSLAKGYSDFVEPLEIPYWAVKQSMDAAEEAEIGI